MSAHTRVRMPKRLVPNALTIGGMQKKATNSGARFPPRFQSVLRAKRLPAAVFVSVGKASPPHLHGPREENPVPGETRPRNDRFEIRIQSSPTLGRVFDGRVTFTSCPWLLARVDATFRPIFRMAKRLPGDATTIHPEADINRSASKTACR